MEWDEKGVREDYVRPHLRRIERRNQFGVYFILKSMELGPSFRSAVPRFPVDNPHYRILARQRSRYTHYYFYIRDEVLGPIALCVGSFLPFSVTYYLNGHHFIERQLERAGVPFRKDDNAFLLVADQKALQAAADRLSPQIIRQQLDHWTWVVGAGVFPERPSRHQSQPPLLPAADRILSQLGLPTELPHPQTLRALLRPRTVPPLGRKEDFEDGVSARGEAG